jgi:elongation factor Ts
MSMNLIKIIREETALSLKDIKKAIDAVGATDESQKEAVIKYLREQGIMKAGSRSDRATAEGSIFSYVHDGRIGVMAVVKCETDFVARSEDFKTLGKNICLHIVGIQPKYVSEDQVDPEFVKNELEIAKTQLLQEGKPEDKVAMILEGKKSKILAESCLLSQPFLMDPTLTVKDYMLTISQKCGENIQVEKFVLLYLN